MGKRILIEICFQTFNGYAYSPIFKHAKLALLLLSFFAFDKRGLIPTVSLIPWLDNLFFIISRVSLSRKKKDNHIPPKNIN